MQIKMNEKKEMGSSVHTERPPWPFGFDPEGAVEAV